MHVYVYTLRVDVEAEVSERVAAFREECGVGLIDGFSDGGGFDGAVVDKEKDGGFFDMIVCVRSPT